LEEKDLISACLKGNNAAQKKLYDTHKQIMMGICMRYSKNREEAQDILQEGFLKVFTDLHKYKPVKPLIAWMRTVMVHTALNYIKRERRKDKVVGQFDNELFNQNVSSASELKENADYLVKIIQQLPDEYQLVFNLFGIEGYSHKEIAEMLDITENTSKVRLLRARKKLQKMLDTKVLVKKRRL